MFRIRLLPSTESGPDGERLGEITVGGWSEKFNCYPVGGSVEQMESRWKEALVSLVDGAEAVVLVHDPRFAYVVYREGERCFVQELLDLDGTFANVQPRQTQSDERDPISEWETTLSAIKSFVDEWG